MSSNVQQWSKEMSSNTVKKSPVMMLIQNIAITKTIPKQDICVLTQKQQTALLPQKTTLFYCTELANRPTTVQLWSNLPAALGYS